jgi:dsDNA-binding SOS-regulon protein
MIGTTTGGLGTMTEMDQLKAEVRTIHDELHKFTNSVDERHVPRHEWSMFQTETREMLSQILSQAKRTNGRVTQIEKERIAEAAVREALANVQVQSNHNREWIKTTVFSLICAFGGGAVVHFLPS